MLAVEFDFAGLSAQLDGLKKAAEDAARPAAQAGAQVFYDEVVRRAPRSVKVHATKGKKHVYQPGNLRRAIYQAFADSESTDGRATYRVSWNKSKAFYGRFVEFGTSKMPARPFLRPAFEAMKQQAMQAAQAALIKRIKERRS